MMSDGADLAVPSPGKHQQPSATDISSIFDKLQLVDRAPAIIRAREAGLTWLRLRKRSRILRGHLSRGRGVLAVQRDVLLP